MTQRSSVQILRATGADLSRYIPDVARLRIEVFRDFPYLYDGDLAYEERYLATYAESPRAVWVLAIAEGQVVGASTALPLTHEGPAFQRAFVQREIDPQRVFYFGESVLLPSFRGQGVGHRFFDEREAHAQSFGEYSITAFAAVDRAPDDPRRPPGYRANHTFWSKRGYERQENMTLQLAWREVGQAGESTNTLTYWWRHWTSEPHK